VGGLRFFDFFEENPMNNIMLNDERQLYVIHCAEGCSAHGYKNVMDHANQIALLLKRDDLGFTEDDYGTLSGYENTCKPSVRGRFHLCRIAPILILARLLKSPRCWSNAAAKAVKSV
jgi:hypothetical protein